MVIFQADRFMFLSNIKRTRLIKNPKKFWILNLE